MTSFILVSVLIVIVIAGLQLLLRKKSRKSVGTEIPPELLGDPFFESNKKKVLFFYSPGCAACKQMMPDIDNLKHEYPDRVKKINVGHSLELSRYLHIMATPSTVILKGRFIEDVRIGVQRKAKLKEIISPGNQ